MRKLVLLFVPFVLLFTISCSSGNKPASNETAKPTAENKKAEPAAPEYKTGRNAFQGLYVAARAFAGDVRPFRLNSDYTPGAPVTEGKAGIWHAGFASASRRAIKMYTWSGVNGEGMPDRGVTHGTEDTYNPSNSSTQVFDIAFLKIDSDKAVEVAQKHGGEKFTKKDPNQPIVFVLDWTPRENKLIWHVIYGTDRNDAKLRIMVDATSGNYIGFEK